MTKRRALVFAYVFPPLGGGGVYRTLKHVKYLPRHGYESVVITTRARWYPPRDETLLSEVPTGTHVFAAPELPVAQLRQLATNPLHRLGLDRALAFIGWPDPYAGWMPGAVWSGLRAVRRFRPDIVYSSSPPVSAHIAALIVSRVSGLPWVADFRDAWALNPQGNRQPRALAHAGAKLERMVARHAERIVIADESVQVLDIDPPGAPRVVIQNGVDADDVPTDADAMTSSRFRLGYVGTLYGAIDAEPVLAALRRLIRQRSIDPARFELSLVGSDFRGGAAGSDVDPVPVRRTGYVDHRRAVAAMAASDALLLYLPPGWRASSGKVYEYLATGRPILCVAPEDSLASRLVSELRAGECAGPDDPDGIERAITDLYRRWQQGELGVNEIARRTALGRYSREALAGRLAKVFDTAIDGAT